MGRGTRVSRYQFCLTPAQRLTPVRQILWPWAGLPWEGENTIVMVSNLERPLGLQSRRFFFSLGCARWEVRCVACCGGRENGVLPSRGGQNGVFPSQGREKASDWHTIQKLHRLSPHSLFQDPSLCTELWPCPPSLLWGLETTGRKLPRLLFNYSSCAPRLRSVRWVWAPPKITLVL